MINNWSEINTLTQKTAISPSSWQQLSEKKVGNGWERGNDILYILSQVIYFDIQQNSSEYLPNLFN